MKNLFKILVITLLAVSCSESASEMDDSFTWEQVETLSGIIGDYSLTKAEWEYDIDLSGDGRRSRNILSQLKSSGFYGTQTIGKVGGTGGNSVFERSNVCPPYNSPGEMSQANLYIPLFLIEEDHNANGYVQTEPFEGRCCIYMSVYQFHYQVTKDGRIEINDNMSYWHLVSNTVPYYEVKIDFNPGIIELTARTHMFDYASGEWQAGLITCLYERNLI